MCGIVGYLGPKDPKEVIINGLSSLEYRGYDSAGVSLLNDKNYVRVRAQGKLENLKIKLKDQKFNGHVGIGHTRWATHGPPVEKNAHPHQVYTVNIVHNGIIENYTELKSDLKSKGSKFESDTDSELIAHLVYHESKITKNLCQAVQNIIPKLEGAFSVLVVSEEYPNEMVAFKKGPPLIIGVNEDESEYIAASDILAIMPHTKNVMYLNDDDVAHIKNETLTLFNKEGKETAKKIEAVTWTESHVEKQGYEHFMLKEIYEQPKAIQHAFEPHINFKKKEVQLFALGFNKSYEEYLETEWTPENLLKDFKETQKQFKKLERIIIVGCGTSFYAGMVGEYYLEKLAGLPVEIELASEFRYRSPIIPKNTLVVFISQSGETADTLAALRQVKSEGILTLSICNVKRSTIDREADGHLYMNSGVEVGVASTKAFVSSLTLLQILSISLAAEKKKIVKDEERQLINHLISAPKQVESVLAYSHFFSYASNTLKKYKGFLYMGRGVNYPIALEGALKLKELAYMHAEGYAAGEMKHGPLALIDEQMAIVMINPRDELYEKTLSNLEEAKARGGVIISIGSGEDSRLKEISEHYLALPEAHWTINPLLSVVPLQLLSYHVANSLGHDVDQPRNLAKSVTVE